MLIQECGLDQYRDFLCSTFHPLDLEPAVLPDLFRANVATAKLGRMELIRLQVSHGLIGQRRMIRGNADNILFQFQMEGDLTLSRSEDVQQISCKHIFVLGPDCRPVFEQSAAADSLVFKMPSSFARANLPQIDDLIGRRFCGSGLSQGLVEVCASRILQHESDVGGIEANRLALGLINLIESAVQGSDEVTVDCYGQADRIMARLETIIEERLHRSDLTVDEIVSAVAVSRSKLYGITRQSGTSVQKMLTRARLARVSKCLADPRHADDTITTLAFEAGFREMAHFSNKFRETYGMSPREFRQREQIPQIVQ